MAIEIDWEICPRCGDAVDFAWETGDAFGRNGFVAQRHNTLIASWVFHSGCWDDFEAENADIIGAPMPADPEDNF